MEEKTKGKVRQVAESLNLMKVEQDHVEADEDLTGN